jgi:hypothetical protein
MLPKKIELEPPDRMSAPRAALAYLPTREQELLLRAALLSGDEAERAWREWEKAGDLDRLDPGSHRLLPLIYQNLSKQGVAYPHLDRLKGVLRLTYYRNQTLTHQVSGVLQRFQAAGVRVLLLKGAGLLAQGAYAFGERPMSDFDVLVPFEQVHPILAILDEEGWRLETRAIEKEIAYGHATGLRNSAGLGFDLHWHAFAHRSAAEIDELFWSRARSVQFKGQAVAVLEPTDQVVHVCVHGARYNTSPSIRWVADCVSIARVAGTALDWEHLSTFAERFALSLPLADCLSYLASHFAFPVPLETLETLKGMPVEPRTRREYHALARHNIAFDNLASYWYGFLRSRAEPMGWKEIVDFPDYLRVAWGKETVWRVAGQLLAWPFRYLNVRGKARLRRAPLLGRVYANYRARRAPK